MFGPCHSCGRYGHYWRACPMRLPTTGVNSRQLVPVTPSSANVAASRQEFNRTNDFLDVVCSNISDNIRSGLSVRGRLSACKQWWYDNLQLRHSVAFS